MNYKNDMNYSFDQKQKRNCNAIPIDISMHALKNDVYDFYFEQLLSLQNLDDILKYT